MSCQKKASLRLPERKNALGGGRKVSASVCRLNFCVICRAPTRALNGRSAAARPVAIRCGCWVRIRPALGGRADGRALPGWYPSSPAAMCRHRTGDVWWLRFVRFCDTFSLRVPWAGDLDRPLAVRRETAARPDGFRSAQIRLNPEAPLQGELAPQATEGSTAKKTSGNSQNSRTPHLLPIHSYLLLPSVPAHKLAVFGVEHYRAPGGEVAAEDFAGY